MEKNLVLASQGIQYYGVFVRERSCFQMRMTDIVPHTI